jgi:tRNA(Ile2) C34 agmatinyltransferase TiaS
MLPNNHLNQECKMDDTEWTTVDENSFPAENEPDMMIFESNNNNDDPLQPSKKVKLEPTEKKKYEETEEEKKTRFLVELEFVQCLANPQYLHCTFYTLSS